MKTLWIQNCRDAVYGNAEICSFYIRQSIFTEIVFGQRVLSDAEWFNNIKIMILNVLGTSLESCCQNPMTGYFRDGFCRTDHTDHGRHTVCAVVTEEFLEFTLNQGNDLRTPRAEFGFPGLKPGDRWCLCVLRWKEAFLAGFAPPVVLEATHISALKFVDIKDLKSKEFAK